MVMYPFAGRDVVGEILRDVGGIEECDFAEWVIAAGDITAGDIFGGEACH